LPDPARHPNTGCRHSRRPTIPAHRPTDIVESHSPPFHKINPHGPGRGLLKILVFDSPSVKPSDENTKFPHLIVQTLVVDYNGPSSSITRLFLYQRRLP
jgi:hypothetical protein